MPKIDRHRNVSRTILRWYKSRGRTLPWRNISDPYRILISEIMLQQTQVSRVLVKYHQFLRVFPTLRSLARANRKDVVLAWRGLGYNNRAVRLHKFAQSVAAEYGGRVPDTAEQLVALPGVGKYTANALLSSAFGKQLPVVDVNIRRLLSRLLWRMKTTSTMRSERDIWSLATRLLPRGRAYEWNQALIDLGATICTARNPKCPECPVSAHCVSSTSMQRERVASAKREPSRYGLPNRLYRGRIVERLRSSRTSVRLELLGKEILPRFSERDAQWLRVLLAGLEKDELIRIRGNGSLATSRAMLA